MGKAHWLGFLSTSAILYLSHAYLYSDSWAPGFLSLLSPFPPSLGTCFSGWHLANAPACSAASLAWTLTVASLPGTRQVGGAQKPRATDDSWEVPGNHLGLYSPSLFAFEGTGAQSSKPRDTFSRKREGQVTRPGSKRKRAGLWKVESQDLGVHGHVAAGPGGPEGR